MASHVGELGPRICRWSERDPQRQAIRYVLFADPLDAFAAEAPGRLQLTFSSSNTFGPRMRSRSAEGITPSPTMRR